MLQRCLRNRVIVRAESEMNVKIKKRKEAEIQAEKKDDDTRPKHPRGRYKIRRQTTLSRIRQDNRYPRRHLPKQRHLLPHRTQLAHGMTLIRLSPLFPLLLPHPPPQRSLLPSFHTPTSQPNHPSTSSIPHPHPLISPIPRLKAPRTTLPARIRANGDSRSVQKNIGFEVGFDFFF